MATSRLNQIRERINIRLYRHKSYVLSTFQVLSIIVSTVAISTIIYFHGFPMTPASSSVCQVIINASFIFYFLKFLVKIVYDFHPVDFIKDNWFEAIIMLSIFIDSLGLLFFHDHIIRFIFESLGMKHGSTYYIVLVQLYLFVIIFIEVGKASKNLAIFKIGPSGLLALSFVGLILSGAGLLYLPEMTVSGIRFIDALFTSTSACCVTGLVVVDTATCFTLKGKFIVMVLIQLGGINIISFATFFATFYKNSAGLRTQSILKDLMATDRISDNRTVLQKIILFSLLSELIGATLLFLTWAPEVHWHGLGEKMFFSLFHSVSAFNNAGFGLFTDNLYDITMRHAYYFQLVICVLIFFGGIGFLVMEDLFSPRRIRERYHYKWKKLAIGSKIAIHTSLALVVAGTIGFYLLEKNNALQGYSWFGALVTSIFQSVTTRTAGFNSIDFSKLGQPILILMMLLMFIGASPGSTGGGIKTTTFTLILRSAWATIRGKKNVEMYKHSISYDLIDKSYSIVLFSLILIFLGCFMLSIAEPSISFIRLLFEEISAFGTVGLSTGITPGLSDPAKLILIGTMYVGRIGTLTLALALTRKAATTRYRYPQTSVMVG